MKVDLQQDIDYSLHQIDLRAMKHKHKLLVNQRGRKVERIHPWVPSHTPSRYWYAGGWQDKPQGSNPKVNKPVGKVKKRG